MIDWAIAHWFILLFTLPVVIVLWSLAIGLPVCLYCLVQDIIEARKENVKRSVGRKVSPK